MDFIPSILIITIFAYFKVYGAIYAYILFLGFFIIVMRNKKYEWLWNKIKDAF